MTRLSRFFLFLFLFVWVGCTSTAPSPTAEQPTRTSAPATETPTPVPSPSLPPPPSPTTEIAPPPDLLPGFVPDLALSRIGKGAISALAVHEDAVYIGASTGVCLYESPAFTEVWCARTDRPVVSLALSPDGARLAAGLGDGHLLLWDLADRVEIANRRISLYEGSYFLEFSPDGSQLAVVEAGDLSLWDGLALASGESLSSSPSFSAPARFSPGGRYLAWIEHPTSVQYLHIYDLLTGETVETLELPLPSHSLDWSPDGETLYVGLAGDIGCYENCTPTYTTEGGLLIFDLDRGEARRVDFDLEDAAVWASALSPDGAQLALHVGAYFPRILVIDPLDPQPQQVAVPAEPHPYTRLLAWEAAGKGLYFLRPDMRLGHWEISAATVTDALSEGYEPRTWVQALSPDGTMLAKFFDHPVARLSIQSVPEGDVLADLELPGAYFEKLRWDPEGRRLALGTYPGLQIYDLETGALRMLLVLDPEGDENIGGFDWTPDGTRLIVGLARWLEENTVERIVILDAVSGEIVGSMEDAGVEFRISPDGQLAAVHRWSTEGASAELTFWELPTGRLRSSIDLSFGLYGFAWAPTSDSLAAFQDRSLIRLDVETGANLWSRSLGPLHLEEAGYARIAFGAGGRWLATAGREIALWDAWNGELVQVFQGHSGQVLDLAFSPDGNYMISAGEDGTVIVWVLP